MGVPVVMVRVPLCCFPLSYRTIIIWFIYISGYLFIIIYRSLLTVQAPGDAEAFCAHLVKTGMVDAVASEDMDTLAFGGSLLLRQLNAKKDR